MASWEIQDDVQDGRQKDLIFFFSKYMSSTQYQLRYNQLFPGFLMNVDDFLGKNRNYRNFHGKYPKYAKFWSFSAPIWSFLRVPGEAKTLQNQIFSFCKKCHIPKCLACSVVSENASINWCNWWQTEKSKMASKIVTKVENSVYSKYESQPLPIAIKQIIFRFSNKWLWFLIKCMHYSS